MIYDKIENLRNYKGTIPHCEEIAAFVEANGLECGSYEVCDGVKVGISEYAPALGGDYEAHREYHDLQFAIKGGEFIDIIPVSCGLDATDYKPDILFFKDKSCLETRVALNEGTFAFLSPDDAHKPCVKSDCDNIRKAVFKIKI